MPRAAQHSPLEKFSSQAHPELLADMRDMAKKEGRLFQALLDEAMKAYLEAKKVGQSRRHVVRAFDSSLKKHDDLYRKLAICSTI